MDDITYMRRANCDLVRAKRAIASALANFASATEHGVRDFYQMQERSRNANMYLDDVIDSTEIIIRDLERKTKV